MKQSDVLKKQPQPIINVLKHLKRREVYKISYFQATLMSRLKHYAGYVVQVTHFHKEALRCKVLATANPISRHGIRSFLGRRQRTREGIPFGAPTDPSIISIPYELLGNLVFTRIPLKEIPLYINEATPLYKRYLAEVPHAPGVYS